MKPIDIINKIKQMIGEHEAVINYDSPFKVLVSTIISQRTRDEITKKVAKRLFNEYDTPEALSQAPIKRLEKIIRGSGFYHEKAKKLKQIAQIISKKGVPKTKDELMKLSGVGPKTANCVLVYAYNKPAIPVDVHVHRIMNRLGVVKTKKPVDTEQELMNLLPTNQWLEINNLLVKFGQRICKPIRPLCDEKQCLLRRECKYYQLLLA